MPPTAMTQHPIAFALPFFRFCPPFFNGSPGVLPPGKLCNLMFFPLKQKVNFPLPLNVLIFVPGDFRDAFCVAGVTLDATGEMSL